MRRPAKGLSVHCDDGIMVIMTLDELQNRAVAVRARYDKLSAQKNVLWDESDLMAGFVGDVGDLSKIIMAKRGLREMDDVDAKLAHELADCLWSVLVLADKLKVDLEAAFQKTMRELDERIDEKLAA